MQPLRVSEQVSQDPPNRNWDRAFSRKSAILEPNALDFSSGKLADDSRFKLHQKTTNFNVCNLFLNPAVSLLELRKSKKLVLELGWDRKQV